ncbi:MAG: Bax inhibitor-1/YccA family protein [Phycisphaerae bacterium]|jgi:uncharacterized YccA/Bax inhibitor family protein
MRTANPALRADTFDGFPAPAAGLTTMTVQGAVNKTALLTIILVASAVWPWRLYATSGVGAIMSFLWGGVIGGLVLALVTIFNKPWAAVTAPLCAVAEGLALGAISAVFEARFPGIVLQAVGLTFGVLLALLGAYASRLIRATENFKLGVFAATGGIALLYLVALGLMLFGVRVPFIHESGLVGIGFSVFVVVIAALNLVRDFDFIESGAARGAPKPMEWYAAFGLLVTLVWLYLEILRPLAKARSRR